MWLLMWRCCPPFVWFKLLFLCHWQKERIFRCFVEKCMQINGFVHIVISYIVRATYLCIACWKNYISKKHFKLSIFLTMKKDILDILRSSSGTYALLKYYESYTLSSEDESKHISQSIKSFILCNSFHCISNAIKTLL